MSAQVPRKRKPAVPLSDQYVKASVLVRVELHARWAAAAALCGQDRSAFAVEAIENRCKQVVTIIDKRKPADRVKASDRPDPSLKISSDGEEAA